MCDVRARHAGRMTQTTRDLVLGAAFLFAFPVAITLTEWAATEPGDHSVPPVVADGSPRR